MNRREIMVAGMGLAAMAAAQDTVQRKGRIQQGACRWCYSRTPIEDLCKEAARLGLKAIDLPGDADVPVIRKYGLVPTVIGGSMSIENGLNRKENHAAFVPKMKERIDFAKANGGPSIIVFSGNRKGMSDQEGAENCIIGLKQVAKYAEDNNIMIVMELLNSKVNHKDYMCDKTPWGAMVMKEVASTHVKLLYDIYHMQIMEGDMIRTIREYAPYIGHYHTGGNPGRNEIDETQEIYYPAVVKAIIDTGFKGYMCHEFTPKREPLKSLAEATALCDV
jgi:hydroxypyruvate isomerase